MSRLEGVLINRRASHVELRASRQNAHAAGLFITSGEELKAKLDAINADVEVLDQDQEAYRLTAQAGINDRFSSGKCTGKISPTTGYNDCITDTDIKFQAWYGSFTAFKAEWQAFLASDPSFWDNSAADAKASRLKVLRSDYERITKRKLALSATPTEAPGGSFFGGGSETAQTLNSIVWLVGLGFAFFIFTTVAAPLLGGAARTKEQWRQLRS